MLLGSPGDHFGSIWRSLGSILAPFCNQVGHRCTQRDPGRSQTGWSMIFDGFWVPLVKPVWSTFWFILWFEGSKSMLGVQAWSVMIFEWKMCCMVWKMVNLNGDSQAEGQNTLSFDSPKSFSHCWKWQIHSHSSEWYLSWPLNFNNSRFYLSRVKCE